MFKKFYNVFKMVRLYFRTGWKITDYIVDVSNIIQDTASPVESDTNRYVCLRDQEQFCIYIKVEDADTLLSADNDIYNKKFNVINVSYLRKHRISNIVTGDVYSKTTPSTVKIKFTESAIYNNCLIYLVYYKDLDQSDPLYNDLLNYNTIKG